MRLSVKKLKRPIVMIGSLSLLLLVAFCKKKKEVVTISPDETATKVAVLQIDNELYCDSKKEKVFICHNGKTICVDVTLINEHVNHGDVLGLCKEDSK